MKDYGLKVLTTSVVNAVLERSGISVEKRQEINDDCDSVVMEILRSHLTKCAVDVCPVCDGGSQGTGDVHHTLCDACGDTGKRN